MRPPAPTWLAASCQKARHRVRKLPDLVTQADGTQVNEYECINPECRHHWSVVMTRPVR